MLEVIVIETLNTKYVTIEYLKKLGHKTVYHSTNTQKLLEFYKEFKPNILLLDLSIGIKIVLKAIKDIMSYDIFANIIIINSGGDEDDVIDSINLGAIDYITRPFLQNELEEKLKIIFGKKTISTPNVIDNYSELSFF